MQNRVNTMVILDGGRFEEDKPSTTYDAARKLFIKDETVLSYPMRGGLESNNIEKIYVCTDLQESGLRIADYLHKSCDNFEVLEAYDPISKVKDGMKFIRVVPTALGDKMVPSIQRGMLEFVVNDLAETEGFEKFSGDWENYQKVTAYLERNLHLKEIPFFFTGNDIPLITAQHIDDMIERFDPDKCDSFIGFTKRSVLDDYLKERNMNVYQFYYTLRKNDLYFKKKPKDKKGHLLRHNNTSITKWLGINEPLQKDISYYNPNRYQSKLVNNLKLVAKIIENHPDKIKEIIRYGLGIVPAYLISRHYLNNSFNKPIARFVANQLNNERILKATHAVAEHEITIDHEGPAELVMDIDCEGDLELLRRLFKIREIEEGLEDIRTELENLKN